MSLTVLPDQIATCDCGSPACCMRDLGSVIETLGRVGPEHVQRAAQTARAAIECMICDQVPTGTADQIAKGLSGLGAFLPCHPSVWASCLEHAKCRPDCLDVLRGLLPPLDQVVCADARRAKTRVVDQPVLSRREAPESGWTMRLTAEIAGHDQLPRAVWLDVTLLDAPAGSRPTHRVPLPAAGFAPRAGAAATQVRVSWDCSLPFVEEGAERIPLACVRHEELEPGSFVCAADLLYGSAVDPGKTSGPVAAYFRWNQADPDGAELLGLGSFGASGQGLLVFPVTPGSRIAAAPTWGGWWWGDSPPPSLVAGESPLRVRWGQISDRRVRLAIGVTAADGSSLVPSDETPGVIVMIPK